MAGDLRAGRDRAPALAVRAPESDVAMTVDETLDALLKPRENGSAALADVAGYLERTLRATGCRVSLHEFVCRPYAGRIVGVVCFLLAVWFFVQMWRRRFGAALCVAALLPLYLLADYELHCPLLSRIGSVLERNMVATFPVAELQRRVILSAHYDTKTDLLDHYQRAPIQFLIVPMLLFAIALPLTALWRRRRQRAERHVRQWAAVVPIYFAGFLVAMTGGAIVTARSPGALDDGASVATLVQLAERLGSNALKLEHTEVRIVLFAGEEVGLQGSASYVAQLGDDVLVPTFAINAEGWGFGPLLSYFTSDRSPVRRYEASTALIRTLDRVHRRIARDSGLVPDIQPVTTDARSFLAAGVPAVTLASQRDGDNRIRFLHSAADSRERIDLLGLQRALDLLQAALIEIDARGVD